VLTIVFQGIESQNHRATLESVMELFDTPPRIAVSISHKSLKSRRLGPSYVRTTVDRFPVVMEAGVSQTSMTSSEAQKASEEYYEFLSEVPQIAAAVEFHHPALPDHTAPADLSPTIIPVWDGKDLKALEGILTATSSVAMTYDGDKRVPALLRRNGHTADLTGGTMLAIGLPDLKEAKQAGFNAVMLSSWVHPGKFGEVSLWDGSKFHRVSSALKQALIEDNSDVIQRAGLDMALLRANDSREFIRLAAYSFISWAQSLDLSSDKSGGATVTELSIVSTPSDRTVGKGVKNVRRTVALPIFERHEVESLESDESGEVSLKKRSHLRPASETVRSCDSCFLSSTCPAYEAASSCAFNFPVEVRTDSQMKALLSSIMELQATRVAFARFAEEVNGGDPDEVVGKEMDRLFRMAERMKKVDEKRERLTVSVESESSGGGTGVLSRIFGEKAQVEPPPAIEADVVVAEIIED